VVNTPGNLLVIRKW